MSTAPRLPLEPDLPSQLAPSVGLSRLRDAELDALMIEGVDWSGQSAQGLQLSESQLSGVDLGGAFLTRGRLRDVIVMEGDWANAMADGIMLRRVRFEEVRLTGVNFSGSTMEHVTFSGCRLDLASFRFANIDSVLFDRCRMEGSDLYDAQIMSATFIDCDLTEVALTGATFERSEMRGCDLSGARNRSSCVASGCRGSTSSEPLESSPPPSGSSASSDAEGRAILSRVGSCGRRNM